MKKPKILTSADVAAELGVSVRQVNNLAKRRGVGILLNARQRVFAESDLKLLSTRQPGRPRDKKPSPAAVYRRERRAALKGAGP